MTTTSAVMAPTIGARGVPTSITCCRNYGEQSRRLKRLPQRTVELEDSMSRRIRIVAAAGLVAAAITTVSAQSPAQAPQPPATATAPVDEHVVANPSYVALH